MSKEDDQANKAMESLILSGALEVAGYDSESDEITYTFTDKIKDVSPELHTEFTNYFHQEMMFLWEKGFVDISLHEEDPKVRLTDRAFNDDEVKKLDKGKKYSLKEIIRLLTQ